MLGKPMHLAAACGLAVVLLGACGKIPRNRFNLNPNERIAQLADLKSDDYCYVKGSETDKRRQSEGPPAAETAVPKMRKFWLRRLFSNKNKRDAFSQKLPAPALDSDPAQPMGHDERSLQSESPAEKTVPAETHAAPTEGVTYVDHAEFTAYSEGETDVARGGGCVYRPLRDIWESILNHQEFKWDQTRIFKTKYDELANYPRQAVVYELGYNGFNNEGDVNYWMYWVHTLTEGTLEKPKKIRISYKMTSCDFAHVKAMFGASVPIRPMKVWEGQIELAELAPGVTVAIIANIAKITRQTQADTRDAAQNLLKKLRFTPPNKPEFQQRVREPKS